VPHLCVFECTANAACTHTAVRALIDAVVADAPTRRGCVETLDTLVNHVAAHEVGHAIYSVRVVSASLAHRPCRSMLPASS
jgi:hypothetical protein